MRNSRFLGYRWIVIMCASWLIGAGMTRAFASDSDPVSPAECVPGRLIVKFESDIPAPVVKLITTALDTRIEGGIPELGVLFLRLPPGVREKEYADLFQSWLPVEYAEPDYILLPAQYSSFTRMPQDSWFDPARGYGWHLTRVGAPAAWFFERGNPQIIIAILDTGINPVPDLITKLVPGWNIYLGNNDTRDTGTHGTGVAGVAAAATNNGLGVAGVAWNCRLMPVRVTASGGSSTHSLVAQGLVWAANHGARVANASLSNLGQHSIVRDAARYFMQTTRGVVVIAAGNENLFTTAPDNPYVIRVSGLDVTNFRATFSDYGNDIDLCAPAYDIVTTASDGSIITPFGTSLAAPIVAGVAGLMLSANPSLSGEQVTRLLQESAVDIGPPGWDPEYGWGIVNAARAVLRARGLMPESVPPVVRITSPANGTVVSGAIWIECEALDPSGISHVELYVDGTWDGVSTRPRRPFTYRVYWDSRTVASGSHTLTIVAYDGMGNRGYATIRVVVNNP